MADSKIKAWIPDYLKNGHDGDEMQRIAQEIEDTYNAPITWNGGPCIKGMDISYRFMYTHTIKVLDIDPTIEVKNG